MNTRNPINITKSSLIGLQAELARKKEEVSQTRNSERTTTTKLELKPHIQVQLSSLKNKKDLKTETVRETPEDESSALNLSNESLIAKSKLYDKLRNQELHAIDSDQFLVDFRKQENDIATEDPNEDSDPESEWVTFVDSLGRSRTCLRTDLVYYKKLDTNISTAVRVEKEQPPNESEIQTESQKEEECAVISEEMQLWYKKRDELRKMWEEEEKRLSEKKDIHYQDVLFEEARTHGVGYFHFSKDETERQKQHEELNKLREETEKNQMLSMSVKERRAQQMKQRIEAAKKRKRERMGLPAESENEVLLEKEEIVDETKKDSEGQEDLAKKIDEMLQNVERSRHVRPWDVGKDGVKAKILTQDEWNERQRAKRVEEFAPPSYYKQARAEPQPSCQEADTEEMRGGLYFTSKKPKREHKAVPINFEYDVDHTNAVKKPPSSKGAEIPPPLSYGKSTLPATSKKVDLGESITMGLNRLKRASEIRNKKIDQSMVDIDD